MRAIFYQQFGGYEQLQLTECPLPQPREGEVLLKMRLAGVSPLDDTRRAGHLSLRQATFPIYPGLSGVGTIVASTRSAFPVGIRVAVSVEGNYGLVQDGTWREYMVAQPEHLTIIPESVSDEDAAAVTTGAGYITPYLALKELAHFTPGWKTAHMTGFMFALFSLETLLQAEQAIFTLLAEGRLKPLVGRIFPLADAAEAQRFLIEGRSFGRVLLRL